MQDLGSLGRVGHVLAMIAYGLRRGREQPVPNRRVLGGERLAWVLAYAVAAVSLSIVFYLRAQLGQPLATRTCHGRAAHL